MKHPVGETDGDIPPPRTDWARGSSQKLLCNFVIRSSEMGVLVSTRAHFWLDEITWSLVEYFSEVLLKPELVSLLNHTLFYMLYLLRICKSERKRRTISWFSCAYAYSLSVQHNRTSMFLFMCLCLCLCLCSLNRQHIVLQGSQHFPAGSNCIKSAFLFNVQKC